MNKITIKYLKEQKASPLLIKKARDWNLIGVDAKDFIAGCMKKRRLDYADWMLVRSLKSSESRALYANYVAELASSRFTRDHEEGKRVVATEMMRYLENPTIYVADSDNISFMIDISDGNVFFTKDENKKIAQYGIGLLQ